MSDFEKNDELKRKYGEVMDSIANDIKQINLSSDELSDLDDVNIVNAESSDDVIKVNSGSNVNDIMADDFIQSISGVDFDNPDEVLNSVNNSENIDTAPLFDDIVFRNEFGMGDSDIDNGITKSGIDLSDELFEDIPDTMTCDECKDLLYDYVSEATDEVENKAIEVHLRNCEMCRVELDDIRDMIGVMSSSQIPVPPFNLMEGLHEKLAEIAPDVKAEYQGLKADSSVLDKAKNAFTLAKDKTDYFIRHANWKVLAPAALSAVLVVGVASSGLYQVMKSSDEIYNFSDDSAIASAKATAKPSASGLDDYVNGNSKTSSTPKSSAAPRSSASSNSAGSSTSPKVTPKPSASSGTSAGLPGISSSSSGSSSNSSSSSSRTSTSSSSSNKTTTSSSSANKNTTSSSSTNKTTTSSSSTNKVSSPTPTQKPYVMPNIILPDIASIMSSNNASSGVVIPDNPAPDTFEIGDYDASADSEKSAADTSSAGGGSANTGAASMTISSDSAGNEQITAESPKPTQKPVPTAAPTKAPADSKATEKPNTVSASGENIDIKRNENGETESFVEKAAVMDDASVVSCSVSSDEVYNKLMSSSLVSCSKIEESGDVIIFFAGSEFVEFTKFLKENDLDYTLMVLGKNEDVKVILHGPEMK